MSTIEIILLIIGGLFFVISFFLPDGKKKEESRITEEEIKALVEKELESAKTRIEDMVEETVNYSVEKTERALERLSNEKIMAVDEYSETVLKKINDNHNEAVFLYDMLNDKDEKLKNVGEELKVSKKEIEKEKKALEEKKLEEKRQEENALKEDSFKEDAFKEEALSKKAIKETALEENKQTFKPFNPPKVEITDPVVKFEASLNKQEKKAENKAKSSTGRQGKSSNNREINEPSVTVHFESDNDGKKNSNEMIRKLHEEGKSNMQIAKELGLGVGEVKLVIDLFASKRK